MRYSRDFDAHSNLIRRAGQGARKRKITQLRWTDLAVGRLLGEGNFSHVYEVRLTTLHDLPAGDDTVVTTATNATKATMATIEQDVWQTTSGALPFQNPTLTEEEKELDIWDLVSVVDLDSSSDEEEEEEPAAVVAKRSSRLEKTYALKHLHPQVTTKQKNFTASAIDLVLEAKILSCLDHPNIVKLFGVTEGAISKVFSGNGYFLLLDRLHETLEEKIREWITTEDLAATKIASAPPSQIHAQARRGASSRRPLSEQTIEELVTELANKERAKLLSARIGSVAIDIAKGMEYLHKHRIVFRDLKVRNNIICLSFIERRRCDEIGVSDSFILQSVPNIMCLFPFTSQPSNVGFTRSNRVKIFDFGLAREIIDSSKRLTGNTGSLRYMAPEGKR